MNFDSLVDELEKAGMESFDIGSNIKNITHPVLIFTNYRPKDICRPICIGLSLEEYEQNRMARKFWSSVRTINILKGRAPVCNSEYGEFDYEEQTYYPFSADLSGYNFDPTSISKLLEYLYEHVGY